MRLSTILAAALTAAVTTQAYEIVLYSDEGWDGDEVSYSLDGQHQLG